MISMEEEEGQLSEQTRFLWNRCVLSRGGYELQKDSEGLWFSDTKREPAIRLNKRALKTEIEVLEFIGGFLRNLMLEKAQLYKDNRDLRRQLETNPRTR